mgnify:CR=1 FL=1
MEYSKLSESPDVMTPEQLRQVLNIGKNSTYQLLRDQSIKSVRIGKRYLVTKQDVMDYLGVAWYNTDETSERPSIKEV